MKLSKEILYHLVKFSKVEEGTVGDKDRVNKLKNGLGDIDEYYDFVIIDTTIGNNYIKCLNSK